MASSRYISTDYRTQIPFRGNGHTYDAPPDGWRDPTELTPGQGFVNCLLANGAIVRGWAAQGKFWTFNTMPGCGNAQIAPVGWMSTQ